MAIKWIAAAKGIRYREHETRKHGKRPDRYWCIQYKLNGKTINEAVGWWSEGARRPLMSSFPRSGKTGVAEPAPGH